VVPGATERFGSARGPLTVKELINLLHILYVDNYLESHREMGFLLGWLQVAESKYIELSRRLDEDAGTEPVQEMETLRDLLSRNFAERHDILRNVLNAREQFAREELKDGLQSFLNAIDFSRSKELDLAAGKFSLNALFTCVSSIKAEWNTRLSPLQPWKCAGNKPGLSRPPSFQMEVS
jgi:hypothetical protein